MALYYKKGSVEVRVPVPGDNIILTFPHHPDWDDVPAIVDHVNPGEAMVLDVWALNRHTWPQKFQRVADVHYAFGAPEDKVTWKYAAPERTSPNIKPASQA